MSKRVLLTGVTSFTGCHIARAFVDAGFEVAATLTSDQNTYTDALTQSRIQHSRVERFFEEASFGNEHFLKAFDDFRPSVYINHGANIKGYRSADFNVEACVQSSTLNLDTVLRACVAQKISFLHSGSVFERDVERSLEIYSPYGLAKTLIWEKIKERADSFGLSLLKVVIPDPVGPFENLDRLAPHFFTQWKKSESVEVRNPEFIWDRVPATWIAQCYLRLLAPEAPKVLRPSAFVESNLQWAQFLGNLFEQKTGKSCPEFQLKGEAQGQRINNDSCPELENPAQVSTFFDEYADWLLKTVVL